MISDQKWSVILEIPQLAHHNPEINQRAREVNITKYSEKQKRYKN